MSLHLAEGNCIVLEVKCNDSKLNCVCEFRKLCGPRDPVIFYEHFFKVKVTIIIAVRVSCNSIPTKVICTLYLYFNAFGDAICSNTDMLSIT